MFGLFGSQFGPFFLSPGEARMLNLMNSLLNDEELALEEQEEKEHEHEEKKGKKEEHKQTSKTYSSIKQSFLNGPHMIEEIRESSSNSANGEKREVTTRRLGNKWVITESVTDKDGNKNTHQRWHNVPENQEEEFNKKWEEHREKLGFDALNDETSTKAIKHEK